jgi:3',5'-cyclic AMP phosphodiesterase CpdA
MESSRSAQTKLMHISDLHFGQHDDQKVDALIKVVEQHRPAIVCVTGDIADSPRKGNFQEAKNFLDKLTPFCGINKFVVPGNHDAFLRSISLNKFRRYLASRTEFGSHINISGLDICIFGVDSTCFSFWDASNTGKFSLRSQRSLERAIEYLRQQLGDQKFNDAVKICLVHHHPLPTMSSELEKMLYFKNCGAFLKIAAQHRFDLILHGHKHEPACFFVDYDHAGKEGPMVILSAGTATKKLERERGISRQTQFYLVDLSNISGPIASISAYSYDNYRKEFWESRRIYRGNPRPKISFRTIHRKFVARRETWNLFEEYTQYVRSAPGTNESTTRFYIGVDPETKKANFSELNLAISQNGKPISVPQHCRLTRDDPYDKEFTVVLPEPVDDVGTEIKYTYEWPEGFRKLAAGRDLGEFTIQDHVDKFTLELEIEDRNRPITDFRVRYREQADIEDLYASNPHKRGFAIARPAYSSVVEFRVGIGG